MQKISVRDGFVFWEGAGNYGAYVTYDTDKREVVNYIKPRGGDGAGTPRPWTDDDLAKRRTDVLPK